MTERLAFNAGSRLTVGPSATGRRTLPVPEQEAAIPLDEKEPRDWAFTWTLLFTAVLFLRPQDLVPPLEFLHLAELTAIAGLVALVTGRLGARQSITRTTPELVGVIALGAVILITAPFSIWMGGAVGVFQDVYSKVILVYLLAVNVLNSPKRLERLTWMLVLALGYIGFCAVLDYVRGINVMTHGTRVRGAVGGILGNPNDLALNMVSFLPFAASFALRADATFMRRGLALLCGAFMLGAIVASGSRGGFLGFGAMAMAMGFFALRRRPGLVIAAVFAAVLALPLVPSSYWNRMASITDESKDETGSAAARRTLLGESWEAFLENPLTGVGAGNFVDWNPTGRDQAWHEAHNVLLQVAAELGIVGLAVFGFLIARAFLAVWQTRHLLRRFRPSRPRVRGAPRQRGSHPVSALPPENLSLFETHSAAAAASIVGWFVCAMFASVAYSWTFYYLLVLAAAPRDMLRARLALTEGARRHAASSIPEVARA